MENSAAMKELLLDTKCACFLCLQTIPTNSENSENDEQDRPNFPVNLRTICRYLRVDIKPLFLQVLGKDCPSDVYSSDLSVLLCGRCETVVQKLSVFVRELEELQMRVDYQVQQFHGILKSSDNACGEKWEGVKEEMMAEGTTEEALVEVRLVELLRKEANTKGGALLKKLRAVRCPIVQVERLNSQIPQDSPELENYKGLEAQMLVTICKRHYKTVPLSHGQGQGFQCFPCGGRTFANPNARDHLFSVHPQFFFQNIKPDNLSQVQFNALCRHALQLEFAKSRRVPSSQYVHCLYCNHRLRNIANRFHHHLMIKHYPMIKDKIVKLKHEQNAGNPERPPTKFPVPNTRLRPPKSSFTDWLSRTCLQYYEKCDKEKRLGCLICHRKINREYAKKHICISHPEKLFERDRLPNVSEAQLKLCCSYLLQTRAKSGNILKCPWKSRNLQLFGNHLVWNHFPQLRQKIKQYQEEKIWNKCPKPIIHTNLVRGQNRAPKTAFSVWLVKTCRQFLVPTSDNKKRCPLCRKELLVVGGSEKMHVIYNHPEKVLMESKLEGVTEEQFKLCCGNLFRVENEAVIYRKGSRPKKCRYCQAPQVHSQGYAIHLVTKHFALLEQKLKESQNGKIGIKVERDTIPEENIQESEPLVEMQVYPEQEINNDEIIQVKMENVMQESDMQNALRDTSEENFMQQSCLETGPLGLLEAEKNAIKNILEQGIQNGIDLALD